MFARSELKFLQKDSALCVNKDVVVDKNGKKYIFIVNADKKLEQREVKLGLRNDSDVENLVIFIYYHPFHFLY